MLEQTVLLQTPPTRLGALLLTVLLASCGSRNDSKAALDADLDGTYSSANQLMVDVFTAPGDGSEIDPLSGISGLSFRVFDGDRYGVVVSLSSKASDHDIETLEQTAVNADGVSGVRWLENGDPYPDCVDGGCSGVAGRGR